MKQTLTMPEIANALPLHSWAKKNLSIINMQGEMVPLDLNIAQRKVHAVVEAQRKAGFPMRVIIVKARREGVSTYFEGRFFWEINRKPMRYACVCSADTDATQKVFKMTKLFQEKIPDDIKLKTDYSNRNEIVYSSPHMSSFLCQTAGKDVLGRGGLTHYLHPTEVGFWNNAKEQLGGALQEVPDDPDTIIALESTANGVGGAFHDMFVEAVETWRDTKDLNNFLPISLPWFIFPAYSKPTLRGFVLDEEETTIQRAHDLTLDQINWRRWAIKNKCQSDLALFKQEYPATWQEAFQASGNPVFTEGMIDYQQVRASKNPRCCVFTGTPSNIGIEDVNRSFNCWKVAELPRAGEQYVLGIDTMENRLSDVQDVKSKLDCDGALMLNRNTGRVVAVYHGRGNQRDFGVQCLLAAYFYNEPWVGPEIPNAMTLLGVFKEAGYEKIYNRQIHDEQYVAEDSENLGWRTTLITRPWLVNELIKCLRERSILVIFEDILEEMRTFIRDKNGRAVHMPGKHDDLLFALMIAIQVHTRCPLEDATYPYDRTGVPDEHKKEDGLAVVGAIDDFDPEEEDWEDDEY